jgi:hypothetical protein
MRVFIPGRQKIFGMLRRNCLPNPMVTTEATPNDAQKNQSLGSIKKCSGIAKIIETAERKKAKKIPPNLGF